MVSPYDKDTIGRATLPYLSELESNTSDVSILKNNHGINKLSKELDAKNRVIGLSVGYRL
ncbi:hypothetical protein [Sphingobacterium paucimobilis]|uniref:Uncharacterized protein n=1 Tax=Sphingobacterium paucimobilis HER1398 TaxID=1346330 RepID=U2J8B9_9SPHI|nr:hypothetical protein [Sphingobacterium paucimobilis]ERJ58913.1 hypothetical protein M472_09030 [Sphingobacterium paucimobilis HER1398]